MKTLKTLTGLVTLLTITASASAQTIYEGFDYTYSAGADIRDENGGFGWGTNWNDNTNVLNVRDGGLSYGSLTTIGNAGVQSGSQDVSNRDFATAYSDGETFWFSFLAARDGTDDDLFQYRLRDSRAGDTDLITLDLDGTVDATKSGLSDDSGFSIPTDSTAVLLVGQVTLSATTGEDKFQYWINPGNLGGASPSTGSYASSVLALNDISSIGNVELVTRGMPAVFDELRYGDSYASVTPIPEPGTFALLAGALGLGWVMLRRRRS
jgi:hypothetical protein